MNNKHLKLEERMQIENALKDWNKENYSFTSLGKVLGKDPTTISKEIRKNCTTIKPNKFNNGFNQCANKFDCKKRHICNEYCKLKCSECEYCNQYCEDFVKAICPTLMRAPYVCNSCPHLSKCRQERKIYDARKAQDSYKYTLSDSRQGINMTSSELLAYKKALKDGLDKGLSFEATILSDKAIPYSTRSAYRHLHEGVFNDILPIDLRVVTKRKIKIHRWEKSPEEIAAFREAKKGRNYDDFQEYVSKHLNSSIVEMDTVVGPLGESACCLTFYFRKANVLLAFKLDEHTSKAVVNKINEIYDLIGESEFKRIFKIILTDNGTEFADVHGIEYTKEGKKRCSLFFCDPMASGQKGRIENQHRLFRYIFPKKTSFINVTQEDITLACNHINNYPRRKLHGSTPFVLAKVFFGAKSLKALGIYFIDIKDVLLKPILVKHK